jgi:drug/metabolite transporter (DMT)-like permease
MLFLLESPFAALFAFLCFGEQLKASQWLGAALILASAAGTVRSQSDPLPDTAAA